MSPLIISVCLSSISKKNSGLGLDFPLPRAVVGGLHALNKYLTTSCLPQRRLGSQTPGQITGKTFLSQSVGVLRGVNFSWVLKG